MKQTTIKHEFVEHIPERLDDGVLYVSITHATAAHKCCCGCGNEVVTPLTPTDWELTYNGVTISLNPSIGNWNFPCQSHYWIRRNKIQWAARWSRKEIERGRAYDRKEREDYFENTEEHEDYRKESASKWRWPKKWF